MSLRLRLLIVVVAALLLCFAGTRTLAAAPADPFVEVPLCQEVHGFAGEVNDHLLIKVPEDIPETGAPVYVIARAFPVHLGTMVQEWLSVNATVDGVRGTVATSNDNGIMRINGVPKGKNLRINVNRVRRDGPVPFRLYTYQASTFTCAIPISDSNSFIAPLPNDQSLVFFAVDVPKAFPCTTVWIEHDHGYADMMGMTTSPPEKYFFYEVDSGNKKRLFVSGDTVCRRSSSEPVVLAYYSHDQSPVTPLVRIKLSYGEGPASDPIPESPGGGGDAGTPDKPVNGHGTSSSSGGGGGFFAAVGRLLLITLILCVGYLVAGSVYNYRSRGITDFPDYIPHVEQFQSSAAAVVGMVRGRGNEYAPVNGAGSERNPFEV